MIIFGCKKNRSADENRERRFFFLSIARPIKNHRHFMRQFPALAVSSVLTSQLLNNKKIVVFCCEKYFFLILALDRFA